MRLLVLAAFCLMALNSSLASLRPNGKNVCPFNETFTTTVQVKEPYQYQRRYTKWCFKVPPRCTEYKTEWGYRFVDKEVINTRLVSRCCPGYAAAPKAIDCSPYCTRPCKHGVCTAPDSCTCEAGYEGAFCQSSCTKGTWGNLCSNNCDCTNGAFCEPVSGVCHCSPGWMGIRCDKPCDEGSYGLDCSGTCDCNEWPCHHITGHCIIPTSTETATSSHPSSSPTYIEISPMPTSSSTESSSIIPISTSQHIQTNNVVTRNPQTLFTDTFSTKVTPRTSFEDDSDYSSSDEESTELPVGRETANPESVMFHSATTNQPTFATAQEYELSFSDMTTETPQDQIPSESKTQTNFQALNISFPDLTTENPLFEMSTESNNQAFNISFSGLSTENPFFETSTESQTFSGLSTEKPFFVTSTMSQTQQTNVQASDFSFSDLTTKSPLHESSTVSTTSPKTIQSTELLSDSTTFLSVTSPTEFMSEEFTTVAHFFETERLATTPTTENTNGGPEDMLTSSNQFTSETPTSGFQETTITELFSGEDNVTTMKSITTDDRDVFVTETSITSYTFWEDAIPTTTEDYTNTNNTETMTSSVEKPAKNTKHELAELVLTIVLSVLGAIVLLIAAAGFALARHRKVAQNIEMTDMGVHKFYGESTLPVKTFFNNPTYSIENMETSAARPDFHTFRSTSDDPFAAELRVSIDVQSDDTSYNQTRDYVLEMHADGSVEVREIVPVSSPDNRTSALALQP